MLRNNLGRGLLTGDSQLKFDDETRRQQAIHNSQIGQHAESQANVWAQKVEAASANNHLTAIAQAAQAGDWDQVQAHEQALTGVYMKQAQRIGGGNELYNQAREKAAVASKEAMIQAVLPTNSSL